jgi:hypothetical protein
MSGAEFVTTAISSAIMKYAATTIMQPHFFKTL